MISTKFDNFKNDLTTTKREKISWVLSFHPKQLFEWYLQSKEVL
jgi:hypothetical protein